MATRRRWLPIVAGIGVLVVFVGIGVAVVSVSWMREHLQVTENAPPDEAERAFAEVRARFADGRPLLELDEHGRPQYVGGSPTARRGAGVVTSVHLLAWTPPDGDLARFELPFWFVRLKSGPITFGASAGGVLDRGVDLDPAVIERFGPGLLLDTDTPDGQHVLVWAQ